MAEITNICIGVQARSGSTRFPRKVLEYIGSKRMLDEVIDRCFESSKYINRFTLKRGVMVSVALLIPEGDELYEIYRKERPSLLVVTGSESNVLSRYKKLMDRVNADYVVRITSDCPRIEPPLITKCINVAVKNVCDYVSNVDEDTRTAPDGHDCEVISKRLIQHMTENASKEEKEHVTLLARTSPPEWANVAHIIGYTDQSNQKISVDTPDDLERVRADDSLVKLKIERAHKKSGRRSVHRY